MKVLGADRSMRGMLTRGVLAALAVAMMAGNGAQAQEPAEKKAKAEKKQPADPKKAAEERYKQEQTYPTRTTWALRSINGKAVPSDYDVTFKIDDNYRGSGFGGCNFWSATVYPQRSQRLAAGPVAVTKKMCDAARMQTERTFLNGIASGPEWSIDGSQLILKNGSLNMVLERAL